MEGLLGEVRVAAVIAIIPVNIGTTVIAVTTETAVKMITAGTTMTAVMTITIVLVADKMAVTAVGDIIQ